MSAMLKPIEIKQPKRIEAEQRMGASYHDYMADAHKNMKRAHHTFPMPKHDIKFKAMHEEAAKLHQAAEKAHILSIDNPAKYSKKARMLSAKAFAVSAKLHGG